ncbi:uncharacterized protein [Coffea arabica]|uniref:Uncharacterized protein isoform X1 n=1 Tax=Coffea arabica TaxID=13443 RepID=A0ABM4UP56_COFAR
MEWGLVQLNSHISSIWCNFYRKSKLQVAQKNLKPSRELAMKVLEPFVSAAVVLRDSIKLLPKNGKLIALTITPALLFSSLFFLVFNFSCKSMLSDMLMRQSLIPLTSTNRADFLTILARLKEDFGLWQVGGATLILAYCIISLFSIISTILVSAISYTERTLSTKDFILLVLRSWKRALIVGFYGTIGLDLGYIYCLFSLARPGSLYFGHVAFFTFYLACIVFYNIIYLHTSVFWALSMVISVMEENCYGFKAVKKATELIQGKSIPGCILNTIFAVLSVILFQGFRVIRGHKWLANETFFWLFLVNFSCLLRLLNVVVFTVLYFECKKNHGEETIDLLAAEEYAEISSMPLADDMP